MTKKKKSVVLSRLAEDSNLDLKAMVAELSTGTPVLQGPQDKAVRKSRRFIASGKFNMN